MHDLSRTVATKPHSADFTATSFELCSLALIRRYQPAHRPERQSSFTPAPDLRSEWKDPVALRYIAHTQAGGRRHG